MLVKLAILGGLGWLATRPTPQPVMQLGTRVRVLRTCPWKPGSTGTITRAVPEASCWDFQVQLDEPDGLESCYRTTELEVIA